MNDTPASIDSNRGRTTSSSLYFTVWRWHFYAGLYVIPFLIMLAVTGLIILWVTAIAPEYGDRIAIAQGNQPLTITAQSEAALKAYPEAQIGKYIAPLSGENPAIFQIRQDAGNRMVALDPYTGTVVQDRAQDGTWNDFATNIHGKLLLGGNGGLGDFLIETAASLGILMLLTGLYLWWPRGENAIAAALVPDLSAKGRAFWKSVHSVTGFWMSIVLVFFLVSGLAWAGVWGGKLVQAWSTFPAEKWDNVPLSDKTHEGMNHGSIKEVPWALEQTKMPESGSPAGIAGLPEGAEVNLENIVALGRAIGFEGRFQVVAPDGETGVWTLSQDSMSYDSPDPTSDRTVHVDRYTGKILASVGFADYSLGGKAMAVGIALHEGQLGLWNIILNIVYCLAVILLSVSGIVMWWLRRPAGAARLMAPPKPGSFPLWKGGLFVAALVAIAFPLAGAALIAVIVLDFIVIRRVSALKQALS